MSRTRRPGTGAVMRFEARKLVAQKRTSITILLAAAVPFVVVKVLEGQARVPRDTLFGRFIHDSGWSIPLLLLGFAGQWLLPLLTSVVAGDIFASEDQHGSWKTIMTRSVSRTQLFLGKTLVAIGFALVAYGVLAASTMLASVWIVGDQPLVGLTGQLIPSSEAQTLVIQSWASVVAPLMGFTCLALAISVITRNVAAGIAAPVAIGFIMQLLGALGGVEFLRPLLLTTPLENWHGLFASPSFSAPLVFGLWVSAGWCLVSIAIAYVVFRRRDYQG
jgi:ABC-2 type transport system permease protein